MAHQRNRGFKSNSKQENEDVFEYLFHCEISNDKSYTEIIG